MFDGLWLVLFESGVEAKAVVLAGPRLLGPRLYEDALPALKGGAAAPRLMKRSLDERRKMVEGG